MPKRTLEEKVEYNKKQNNPFSRGYLNGVRIYQSYGKMNASKTSCKCFIDSMRACSKNNKYAKGFMCGIRDASIERKARKQQQ